MRLSQLLSIGLLATVGLSAIASSAVAGINKAKDTSKSGTYPYVVVTGLTPYESYKVYQIGASKTFTKKANDCGFIKLSATSTSLPLALADTIGSNPTGNGAAFVSSTVQDLPVEAAPKCTNGVLTGTNLTPSARLRTAEGDVYITGLGDFASHDFVNFAIPLSKNVKSNGCGVLKVGEVQSPSFSVKSADGLTTVVASTTVASLTAVGISPACTNNTLLLPAGFPNL